MLKRDRKRRDDVQIDVGGAIATTISDYWPDSHRLAIGGHGCRSDSTPREAKAAGFVITETVQLLSFFPVAIAPIETAVLADHTNQIPLFYRC